MAEEKMPHSLSLTERSKLAIQGVTDVVTFEESAVVLRTAMGTLVVHGRDMQLKNLSPEGGKVTVEGTVSALIYEEPRASGWFSQLFR